MAVEEAASAGAGKGRSVRDDGAVVPLETVNFQINLNTCLY